MKVYNITSLQACKMMKFDYEFENCGRSDNFIPDVESSKNKVQQPYRDWLILSKRQSD